MFTNKNTFLINHKYTKSYKPSVKAKITIIANITVWFHFRYEYR